MNPTPPRMKPEEFEPAREDILIGRVVDGEASAPDWDDLESIARTDAAIWERLGRAQRAHARLERDVEDAIAIVDLIEAPSARKLAADSFTLRIRRYGGWAVAAVLAIAWVGAQSPYLGGHATTVPGQSSKAGIGLPVATLSPDEALDQYVRAGQAQGRVIGQMQPVLIDARELEGGKGKEVYFVRQIIERTTVTDLAVMNVQTDEHGRKWYVPEPVRIDKPDQSFDQKSPDAL